MVALNQLGCHRHRFTDVCETLATNAVDWKLASLSWLHVHTGKIAYRVVVFRVTEPTERHRPRVASSRVRLGIERCGNPTQQLFPLSMLRLRLALRRHVSTTHPLGNIAKHFRSIEERTD